MSKQRSFALVLSLAAAALALEACSASVTISAATATAVTSDEQGTATAVAVFATSSPPSGATEMGMMSSPQAGPVTIPITNADVYTFTADIDDSGNDETMYWAVADDGTVYVWGDIDLECVDDNGNSTGETGTADFVYEATEDGYGWMTATDSCGYSTYYGCSADSGDSETCGGCDFNDEFIACTAVSS